MVTGISTGALTAPFAFLGPDYDDQLKMVYTTTSTKDVLKERKLLSSLFSDSMTDTTPLKAMDRQVCYDRRCQSDRDGTPARPSSVRRYGQSRCRTFRNLEYRGHRRKRSSTQIGVDPRDSWASAAIPVIFPPIAITVESNGRQYEELHVDGGTGYQVFVYPAAIDWKRITNKLKVQGDPKVYVIRNSFIETDYKGINRSLVPIASRSIDSLIRTQGIGDLCRIYALCERDGNDFNLAYIPAEFTESPNEGFDPVTWANSLIWDSRWQLKGIHGSKHHRVSFWESSSDWSGHDLEAG